LGVAGGLAAVVVHVLAVVVGALEAVVVDVVAGLFGVGARTCFLDAVKGAPSGTVNAWAATATDAVEPVPAAAAVPQPDATRPSRPVSSRAPVWVRAHAITNQPRCAATSGGTGAAQRW
jgi:hypothetical protein